MCVSVLLHFQLVVPQSQLAQEALPSGGQPAVSSRTYVPPFYIRPVTLKSRTKRGLPFINHSSLNFLYVTSKRHSVL